MWKSAVVLILGALGGDTESAPGADPQEGSYYSFGQLGVKELEVEGSKIELTFQPKAENAYWCPGITIQETKKAVAVTFVRCATFKSCTVDVDATIGRHLIRTVTIDTRGKDTYVKNGPKKYRRIYSAAKEDSTKKSPAEASAPAKLPIGAKVQSSRKNGWIINTLVQPDRVPR